MGHKQPKPIYQEPEDVQPALVEVSSLRLLQGLGSAQQRVLVASIGLETDHNQTDTLLTGIAGLEHVRIPSVERLLGVGQEDDAEEAYIRQLDNLCNALYGSRLPET